MTRLATTFRALCLSLFALSFQVLAANVVVLPIYKPAPSPEIVERDYNLELDARATVTELLYNNVTGGVYMANVTVGTPGQSLSLAIDTGSSDAFVLAATADQCTMPSVVFLYGPCVGGTFNPKKSSTFRTLVKGGFSIKYIDQSVSDGDYFSDTFQIDGVSISALQMGLALKTTVGLGIIGIGYNTGESVNPNNIYPNLIDQMVAQGQINTKLYSLYLDDLQASTGSILFGGIDTKKFIGALKSLPTQPDSQTATIQSFMVLLTSVSFTAQDGSAEVLTDSSFSLPVILDSGTTLTYLPSDLFSRIVSQVGGVSDPGGSNTILVDCNLQTTDAFISFKFGASDGPIIKVPISEVIWPLVTTDIYGSPFERTCGLAIKSSSVYILGDTFLRSAYVVYDITNNEVALAQSNFEATDSNIVEVSASATAIPLLAGVASGQTKVTSMAAQTGTPTRTAGATSRGTGTSIRVGTGTASRRTSATRSSTASGASATSSSGTSGARMAFESGSLAALAISLVFALVGRSVLIMK